ncbi:MAG: phosphatidyl-myo-inositol dimannoside synthase [Actinomycetota bacterium]|jgi:phosphatidylinositol alpha-1,6-mannosyltransferase|nr:phosphatidyl-myo-inositol dimannoside synthase [Actinomycetota bacterium]
MARTLVVTNDFPPRVGGIESFVLAMVSRMPPDEVVVHTARQAGDAAFDGGLPFPVVRDPSRIMLPTRAITGRSVQIARDLSCNSVWFGAAAPLGLMARSLKERADVLTTVATTHGHEVWWAATPGARTLLRRIGDTNDVLTYLGTYTRHRIARALSAQAGGRMVQLTPGVDDVAFRPDVDGSAVRERYGLVDRPVVVCVSRLVERKGQDMLVRALPLIQRRVPGAAVLLVGDGPHRTRVEGIASQLGVTGDVIFAGAKPWAELPPYYAAGEVFAMPSRTRKAGLEVEGLGIVYLEASASGLPVVAGDSGGAPDAVQDGTTGYVVNGRSPGEIADRVSTLLLDPALSARMGEWGRRWVEQRWRWDDLAANLRGLLATRSFG